MEPVITIRFRAMWEDVAGGNPSLHARVSDPVGRILLVEGAPRWRADLGRALESSGHSVVLAYSGKQGRQLLNADEFDIVITDVGTLGPEGTTLVEWIRLNSISARIIVSGEADDAESVRAAFRKGADDYILRTEAVSEFIRAVTRLLRRSPAGGGTWKSSSPAGVPIEDAAHLMKYIAHDLGSALSVFQGVFTRAPAPGHGSGHTARCTRRVRSRLLRLRALSEDILSVAFALSHDIMAGRREVQMNRDVIRPVLLEFAAEFERLGVRVVKQAGHPLVKPPAVIANRVFLRTVCRAIFRHAVASCPPCGRLFHGVEKRGTDCLVEVGIEGGPPGEIVNLPAGLEQEPAWDNSGGGVSLSLARHIVLAHAGELRAEPTAQGWSFLWRMPGRPG